MKPDLRDGSGMEHWGQLLAIGIFLHYPRLVIKVLWAGILTLTSAVELPPSIRKLPGF